MSCPFSGQHGSGLSRRLFLAGAGGLVAGVAAAQQRNQVAGAASEPFYGDFQAGIATPQQLHTYFAAFDLAAKSREEVVAMLRAWTQASERLTKGLPAGDIAAGGTAKEDLVDADGATALGLGPARLTLTFGFGAGLFVKDGADRYGLAGTRPPALVDLPKFHGDQLEEPRCGGDISVQACADDPQVAFHAVRELARIAYGAVRLRWVQAGFLPDARRGETPRNLMGFKDGTNNPVPGQPPRPDVPKTFEQVVWVGQEGPAWMQGGSYLVARRIRISLEHWDRTQRAFQEEVIGRHKISGAPIGKREEFAPLDLDRADDDGNSLIADTAHVRLGAPALNDGAQILRRGYSYNDGANFTAERWPPWRQGVMYDAGLLFLAYQRDPRFAFIRIFENMAKMDALNQYTTHTGSAVFACPGGVRKGEYIGQRLFEPT